MKLYNKLITACICLGFILLLCEVSATENHNRNKFKSLSGSETKIKSKMRTSTMTEVSAFVKMVELMKTHTESQNKNKKSNHLDIVSFLSNLGHSKKKVIQNNGNFNLHKFKEQNLSKSKDPLYDKTNPNISTSILRPLNEDELTSKNTIPAGDTWMEWWSISSPDFKNHERHPPVLLTNGTAIEIQVDSEFNRFNPAFYCPKETNKPPTNLDFWFRLNNNNLFYSSTKTDMNILGNVEWMKVINIVEVIKKTVNEQGDEESKFCFKINDESNMGWELCTTNSFLQIHWVCRIKGILGMPIDEHCKDTTKIEEKGKEMLNTPGSKNSNAPVIQEVENIETEVVIPLPSRQCNENWNYRQKGADWECICKEGNEQSPIDLPSPDSAIDSSARPFIEYSEVGPNSRHNTIDEHLYQNEPIVIRNRKFLIIHDINFGKIVTLDGAVYRAEEVIFHTPSNHKINGVQYPLEISIIHYGISKGDIAKQVVLSFLFEKKPGIYNQFLDDIDFYNLPNSLQGEREIFNPLYIPKILYNFRGQHDGRPITMKPFSFYTYQGSLMFPPCTERTIHFVASKPLQVGSTAIKLLEEALRRPDEVVKMGKTLSVVANDDLPVSNREIQPLNGRPVFHYNYLKYCPFKDDEDSPNGPQQTLFGFGNMGESAARPVGHYEKMKRDVTNYFYVGGSKPSGIPGSFVVPDEEAGGKEEIPK